MPRRPQARRFTGKSTASGTTVISEWALQKPFRLYNVKSKAKRSDFPQKGKKILCRRNGNRAFLPGDFIVSLCLHDFNTF